MGINPSWFTRLQDVDKTTLQREAIRGDDLYKWLALFRL